MGDGLVFIIGVKRRRLEEEAALDLAIVELAQTNTLFFLLVTLAL